MAKLPSKNIYNLRSIKAKSFTLSNTLIFLRLIILKSLTSKKYRDCSIRIFF